MATRQEECDWVKAKIQVYYDLKLKKLTAIERQSGHPEVLWELWRRGLDYEKDDLLKANQKHFDMLDRLDEEIQKMI